MIYNLQAYIQELCMLGNSRTAKGTGKLTKPDSSQQHIGNVEGCGGVYTNVFPLPGTMNPIFYGKNTRVPKPGCLPLT